MSYSENWLRHLFAPLTGEGLSNHLARDFWIEEDLWNPSQAIRRRFLKLWWVYSASTIAQIALPLTVTAFIINIFEDVSFKWWAIAVGGTTTLGLIFALTDAVLTDWRIRRAGKQQEA
jgi:hypothetical protein